jgi:hypothetical protein
VVKGCERLIISVFNLGGFQPWRFSTLAVFNLGGFQPWRFSTLAVFNSPNWG